jgi:hypothetical protein
MKGDVEKVMFLDFFPLCSFESHNKIVEFINFKN